MGLTYPTDVRVTGIPTTPLVAVNAAVKPAATAYAAALVAGLRTAAATDALRRIDREIAVTRRRLRAIEKRWLPWLHESLRALELSLEQAEQEDGVRMRRAVASAIVRGAAEPRTVPVKRLLVAVDDSADSLAAARLAIDLAMALHAQLRVIHVSADHLIDATVAAASDYRGSRAARPGSPSGTQPGRRNGRYRRGAGHRPNCLSGDTGPVVLATAQDWPADLVIVGKSARSASGEPYVGTNTRHILEFAEQPVIVVPMPGPDGASRVLS